MLVIVSPPTLSGHWCHRQLARPGMCVSADTCPDCDLRRLTIYVDAVPAGALFLEDTTIPHVSRPHMSEIWRMQRIQVTHAGSLIRPPELLAYLSAVDHGRASTDSVEYQASLARAVAYVVRRQAETGIDVIDDGEMGKATWITYLYERTSRPGVPAADRELLLHPAGQQGPAELPRRLPRARHARARRDDQDQVRGVRPAGGDRRGGRAGPGGRAGEEEDKGPAARCPGCAPAR